MYKLMDAGNLIPCCNASTPYPELHAYWDACANSWPAGADVKGSSVTVLSDEQINSIKDAAEAVTRQYPRSYFGGRLTTPDLDKVNATTSTLESVMSWMLESNHLARTVGYGDLSWAISIASEPPSDYAARAKVTCQSQVAIAGYRLADLLNTLHKQGGLPSINNINFCYLKEGWSVFIVVLISLVSGSLITVAGTKLYARQRMSQVTQPVVRSVDYVSVNH